MMHRRNILVAISVAALLGLTGCAGIHAVTSEVSSFGQWPQGQAPGTYVIERLPSQMVRAEAMRDIEIAAGRALERSGFKPAANAASADVVVQLGSRITRYEISPWDDPLWWRWGPRYWRGPGWPGMGSYYGSGYWVRRSSVPEREVAILLRDRASTVPLYEARAVSMGSLSDMAIFEAMFVAALSDFPKTQHQRHSVTVPLAP